MAARLAFVAVVAVCPVALAFSDNFPLVAWSSTRSAALDALPSTFNEAPSASFLENVLADDRVCEHDAILLIEQPGLRASDLRSLSPTIQFVSTIASAPSSKQYPYLPGSAVDFASLAENISRRCPSHIVATFTETEDQVPIDAKRGDKHVRSIKLPEMKDGSAKERVETLSKNLDDILAEEVRALAASHPNHLVIYSGSRSSYDVSSSFVKRQLPALSAQDVHAAANTSLPVGGILKRYQLLTPGLITTLLVVFFVIVPIIVLGVSALASIQSPLRVEAPKGYNARERKNQ